MRKRNGGSGGGRGKTVFALLMALVLLGGIGGGAYVGFDRIRKHFVTPDYDGPGTGEALLWFAYRDPAEVDQVVVWAEDEQARAVLTQTQIDAAVRWTGVRSAVARTRAAR